MEKIRAKQVFTVETLDELRFLLTCVALNYIILCPNLELYKLQLYKLQVMVQAV